MKRKTPEAKLREKLWGLCKEITRKRYKSEDGTWNCYTCDRRIEDPAQAHTGHLIPSSVCGVYLRFDLRNLRVQCYRCNINGGGMGAEYCRRMEKEVGREALDQLFADRNKIVKGDKIFYQNKIEEYERL